MKTLIYGILIFGCVALLLAGDPIVENVRFEQRTDGSLVVDIYYDVLDEDEDLLEITINASDDHGATWVLSCTSLTGDVGEGVTPGADKHAVWDFYADNPGVSGDGYRVRVLARENVILPTDGLIVYYPFTGNANDSSGHNLHGDLFGPILTQDRDGKMDQAYLFDGVDDFISLENRSVLNFTTGLTISVWAKGAAYSPNNGKSLCGLVSKGPVIPYGLGLDGGDRVLFRITNKGTWYEALKTNLTIDSTLWYHYVGVFKSGNFVRLYINGEMVINNTSSIPQAIDSSDYDLWIGTRSNSEFPYEPKVYFRGTIDEVRIYNRPLENHEIQKLYKLYD